MKQHHRYQPAKLPNAFMLLLAILVAVVYLSACTPRAGSKQGDTGDTIKFAYADNITAVHHGKYTVVKLANPWKHGTTLHTYILVARSDSGQVSDLPEGTVVYTPLTRNIVFTAPHCQLLQWLGAGSTIAGVCDMGYMHQPYITSRVANGNIADCGSSMSPSVERMATVQPQAIFVSPYDNSNYGALERMGVPIIECADYMETSALGRAEWMRFYGMLAGRNHEADSLFAKVVANYQALASQARKAGKGKSIITEKRVGGVWYCPGGQSSMARLIADAGGRYVFADDPHSGSLTMAPEAVLQKAENADTWIFVYSTPLPPTRKTLLAEYDGYKVLRAFREGNVYACDSEHSTYFEELSFRPDMLLRDLVQILHPDIKGLGPTRYYHKIEM